ncbi:MAG: hypothetical protein R2850_00515 [Bacteroidia bacterium]
MNQQSENIKRLDYPALAGFPALIYFPVFYQLGADAIGMWDESLYALRAFQLSEHGEILKNFNQFYERY